MSSSRKTWIMVSAILLGNGIAWAATAASNSGLQAQTILDQAILDDAPYRNAMYLYLRLAGIVWIAVEWTAAILLWRASRLLAPLLTSERPTP